MKITPEQLDLVYRRTSWILRACIGMNWSIRDALAHAYFAGLCDCTEVFAQNGHPPVPPLQLRSWEC